MKNFIAGMFLGMLALGTTYAQENMDSVGFDKWTYKELDSLVTISNNKGSYKDAFKYVEYSAKKIKIEFGEQHPMYERCITNSAAFLQLMGEYKAAELKYQKAINLNCTILNNSKEDYVTTTQGLAVLYVKMGRYEEAKTLFIEVLTIRENILGKVGKVDYAGSLSDLGLVYEQLGMYEDAESCYLSALKITKEFSSSLSWDYANVLTKLGGFYTKIGQYKKAEKLLLQSIEITKKEYGVTHPRYIHPLSNLGNVYEKMKEYKKIESIRLEAIKLWKSNFGTMHPNYAMSLANLAKVYHAFTKDYAKAENFYLEAIDILNEKLGKEHPTSNTILNNLAGLYMRMKRYDEAKALFIKIKEARHILFGKFHPEYITTISSLGVLELENKNYKDAELFLVEASSKICLFIRENYKFLTEENQFLFLAKNRNSFFNLYQLATKFPSPKTLQQIQNIHLSIKGLSLSRTNTIREFIKTTNDSLLNETYNNWQYTHHQIAKATTLSIKERQKQKIDLDSLLQQSNEQERQLARQSKVIEQQLKYVTEEITFNDLKNKLSSHEVCIDILHFPFYKNDGDEIDSIVYYALLTNSIDDAPKFIKLGIEKKIKDILKLQVSSKRISYVSDAELSSKLYQILWTPLLPYLEEVKTIHLSVSGVLHKVAFGALKGNSNKEVYLVDQYNLHYYGTLRDFIFTKDKKTAREYESIVLFGGADFNLDSSSLVKFADSMFLENENFHFDQPNQGGAVEDQDSSRGKDFNNLKGSLKEVEQIHTLFEQKEWSVQTFSKDKALEGVLKKHSGKKAPSILHIATHGYFFSKPKQSVYYGKAKQLRDRLRYHPNPLFRSGLAFSGVNYVWNGGIPIQGLDDGVLTAYEVTELDLYNTQLVVLSACETGKGDIDNNEGVLGLQRAFKTAGVDQLIISLWKVDDIATSLLMEEFYRNYLKGQSTSNALNNAQNYLRHYSNKEGDLIYSIPYFWAGFILIE